MERKQRPHKNLVVWKESIQLIKMIYRLCQDLPADEKFGIISQMKRASVSVSLNIAEGAARKSEKEFNQFLTISSGSLSELDTLIEVLLELEYISLTMHDGMIRQIDKVTALLNGLRRTITLRIKN
jgi:four helix bundle protein